MLTPGPGPRAFTSSSIGSSSEQQSYSDRFPRPLRSVQMTIAPSAKAMPRPAPRAALATPANRPRNAFGFILAMV